MYAVCTRPGRVDHLINVYEAMRGETWVPLRAITGRLADLDPDTYRGWHVVDARSMLERHGVSIARRAGIMGVRLGDVEREVRCRLWTT